MTIDLKEYDDDELAELRQDVSDEQERRLSLSTADKQIDEALTKFLVASGRKMGDQWEQPTGYMDVYPKGWETTHDGGLWVSKISGNNLEPGVSGWAEKVPDDKDGNPQYPVYTAPVGWQDSKSKGQRFWFPDLDGKLFESLIDKNSWSPSEAPHRWKDVTPDEPEKPLGS